MARYYFVERHRRVLSQGRLARIPLLAVLVHVDLLWALPRDMWRAWRQGRLRPFFEELRGTVQNINGTFTRLNTEALSPETMHNLRTSIDHLNETTNGLLRQYFPKRTEIAHFTQADLDDVAAELNDRPRQTLGWRSPSQALDEALR